MSVMQILAQILSHTPPWVWGVLVLLVALGLMARRSRVMPLGRVLVMPAIFLCWGVATLGQRSGGAAALIALWAAMLLVGAVPGWRWAPSAQARPEPGSRRLMVPGSLVPLVLGLGIFVVKYVLAVALGMQLAEPMLLRSVDLGLSGLMAGFFLAGLARLLLRLRQPAAG